MGGSSSATAILVPAAASIEGRRRCPLPWLPACMATLGTFVYKRAWQRLVGGHGLPGKGGVLRSVFLG